MNKRSKKLIPMSIVEFNDVYDCAKKYKYPFKNKERVLCLGEVVNMPGHYAIAKSDGKISYGWHPENFKQLTDEET